MINAKGKTVESLQASIIESAPAKRIGAYLILQDGKMVGKLLIKYPADGTGKLIVNLYDYNNHEIYYGFGYSGGYDWIDCALSGLSFGGHKFEDITISWQTQLSEWGYNTQWVI